jgi:hypothetical protein
MQWQRILALWHQYWMDMHFDEGLGSLELMTNAALKMDYTFDSSLLPLH